MELPRITVITPSFNQASYLEDTIRSVLDQGIDQLEYMIFDGGSRDGSVDIIRRYEKHLTYWESVPDRGQSDAINKGLRRATGTVLAWLNSDDLYEPGSLRYAQAYFAAHPETGLLHGDTLLFTDQGASLLKRTGSDDLRYKYFATMPFSQPSSFFHRRVIDETGLLDERLHYGMDFDLLVRIALRSPIQATDQVFSRYRIHPGSKTTQDYPRFLNDWQIVFSRLLRSLSGTESLRQQFSAHGFYREGDDRYAVTQSFTPEDVNLFACHFLNFQVHGYYTVLDRTKALSALHLLRSLNEQFYDEHKGPALSARIRFAPAGLVRLLRKLFNTSPFTR